MNWVLIRETLEALLKGRGWSHNDLSDKSGVPQPTISRFLSKQTEWMTLDTLSALARALDVTIGELIGEQPMEGDDKVRRVIKAMQQLPDYKRDVLVSTAETLVRGER